MGKKKEKIMESYLFFMAFHIKLYGWLRSFQTPFLSPLQGRALGKLLLLKDLIHSVALLTHLLHDYQ